MNAKGMKEEPYDDEAKEIDLEEFKSHLEKIVHPVQDPRAKDNQKHSLFTLIAIIFCAMVGGANSISAIYRYASSIPKVFQNLDFRLRQSHGIRLF